MNQQDIDELTEVFVEESQEIVEHLNKDILELEKAVGSSTIDREVINNIFRYVHTLKGNSGLAGADKLRDLAHKMESLLDRLRKDKMTLTPEIVDLLFHGIDRIGAILKEIISGTDQGVVIDDLVGKLETILMGQPGESQEVALTESPAKEAKRPVPPPVEKPPAVSGLNQYTIPDDIKRILTEYEENRLLYNLRNKLTIYELILNLAMEGFDRIVTAVIDKINASGEVIAKVPSSKTLPGYDLQVRIIFAFSGAVQRLAESLAAVKELSSQDFSLALLIEPTPGVVPPKAQTPPSPSVEKKTVKKAPVSKPEVKKPVEPPPSWRKLSQEEPAEAAGAKAISMTELAEPTGNTVRVDIKKLDNLMNIVGELVLAKARYVQFESEIENLSAYKMLRENFKRNNKFASKKLEDLREGILQVRMVQVGSLFNRFPRIVRDLAKSHDKQIRLVLEGKETELDKAVIDEMGDPLIHLIRNAVDHGIENLATRRERGKPDNGTITLRAYHEGSYIVIEMEDDGAGINLERVREKAIEVGLIDKNSKISDSEILSFIFHPGFSTARQITDTSGRGVGMDVVKTAIMRLKGIIDIKTRLYVGTKFIIKLPLTLAIIQVLLIKINNQTYAIPLSSVTESFRLNREKIEMIDEQEVTQLRDVVLPLLRLHHVFNFSTNGSQGESPIEPQPELTEEAYGEPQEEAPGEPVEEQPEPQEEAHGEPQIEEPPESQAGDQGESLSVRTEEGPQTPEPEQHQFVVVIGLAEKRIGLVVDNLLGQQEIVIKPLGKYLLETPGFAGATTLGDGRVVLILDVVGLVENLNRKRVSPKNLRERQPVMG